MAIGERGERERERRDGGEREERGMGNNLITETQGPHLSSPRAMGRGEKGKGWERGKSGERGKRGTGGKRNALITEPQRPQLCPPKGNGEEGREGREGRARREGEMEEREEREEELSNY